MVEDVLERLEQISAIVVAVGLALVSYWLFFSWAGGGDAQDRPRPDTRAARCLPDLQASKTPTGLVQPAAATGILQFGHEAAHLLWRDRESPLGGQDHQAFHGAAGVVQRLTVEGGGELPILADGVIQLAAGIHGVDGQMMESLG